MKNILSLLGALFILFGCNVDKGKKVDVEQLDFETSDRSEIFFKNMRQSSYITVENTEAGVYLYTHQAWEEDTTSIVVPTIVFNWRQDKAYIMLNWSRKFDQAAEVDIVVMNDSLSTTHIVYQNGNMKEQLKFAAQLYNGMADGSDFLVEDSVLLFNTNEKKEAFRVTVYDFLRLTGWY